MSNKRIYIGLKNGGYFNGTGDNPWIYFIEGEKEFVVTKSSGLEEPLKCQRGTVSYLVKKGIWSVLTPQQVAAFRPELAESMDSEYFGLVVEGKTIPFNEIYDPYIGAFKNGETYFQFLLTGKKESFQAWSVDAIKNMIDSKKWAYFTNLEVEKLFAKYPGKSAVKPADAQLSQYYGYGNPPAAFSPTIKERSYVVFLKANKPYLLRLATGEEKPLNIKLEYFMHHYGASWQPFTQKAFDALVEEYKNKPMPIIASPQKAVVKNIPFTIKKGSLYFNITTKQVERVITIQDTSLIWSSKHKQEVKAYPRSAFRKATADEVDAYLSSV